MEEIRVTPEQEKKSRPNTTSAVIIGLLKIILVLLIFNLGATGYLIYKSQQNVIGETTTTNEPLPAELNSAQGKTALFEKLKEPFNNMDNEKLYALLDPLLQVEVTSEEFDAQMPLFYQLTGSIKNGVYSHYEYVGISDGKKWFTVYYKIQTDNGMGTLNITIVQVNQEPYTIWGFHIER